MWMQRPTFDFYAKKNGESAISRGNFYENQTPIHFFADITEIKERNRIYAINFEVTYFIKK